MVNNEPPDESANDVPDEGEGDDLGSMYFGFLGEECPEERLNLKDLGLTFENGQPEMEIGKRAFANGITVLNDALAGYSRVLAEREGKLAELLMDTDTDPLVLDASDRVHEALFRLKAGHQAYTGHPFLGDPLMRTSQQHPDPDQFPEDDFDYRAQEYDEDDSHGPIGRELGVVVPLNLLLQSGSGTLVQVAAARVYGNGVMLAVECAQVRGQHEDLAAWRLRGRTVAECELEADDPVTGSFYLCSVQGMEPRDFNRVNRCGVELWMPGVLGARRLRCVLKVENFPDIHGDAEPLGMEFELDPEVLRQAAARIHRP
ncbi:hypothetical protein [Paeniglutamicibacter kerguelensis]|uniref:Uncharacterized protein n=1 Tax=Paeniglutamicibacter kerguelensis TaxID=254788 RepID=A0ABS4XB66_9MICC|nr:hypothetical protein [Paeniglutamicibacter kerguelensis]MBP2385712.1 hypothetical protein [Paeniglutamicibacter kerguelensis]